MVRQIPGDIPIWPIIAVVLLVTFIVLWRRRPGLSYIVCLAVFGVYLFVALDRTLLPIEFSGPYVDVMRQVPFMSRVNVIPFFFSPIGTLQSSLSTLLLNIILTIPFGFGVNFLTQVKVRNVFPLALAVGIGIEGAQLAVSLLLRYVYRIIDINDVLMNTLGVLIGYGIFRLFAAFYVFVTQRFDIK